MCILIYISKLKTAFFSIKNATNPYVSRVERDTKHFLL